MSDDALSHEEVVARTLAGVDDDGILFESDYVAARRVLAALADATKAPDEVMGAWRWGTNAALIADVARLGYLKGSVLDMTHGEGAFWRDWKPEVLVTNDRYKTADHAFDYRNTGFPNAAFDSVVFDPDYKLTGTPASTQKDFRYGTDRKKDWKDRMEDIRLGAIESWRVTRKYLLVKCMDQVCSAHPRWQTDMVTTAIEGFGGFKEDRFDFIIDPQPQPKDRRQVHARRNHSTLLVFRKPL